MKIMLDLTVLLDVFQERFPHYPASAAVISRILHKEVSGILPSHALTTIHYLVAKYSGRGRVPLGCG